MICQSDVRCNLEQIKVIKNTERMGECMNLTLRQRCNNFTPRHWSGVCAQSLPQGNVELILGNSHFLTVQIIKTAVNSGVAHKQ